jgi:hypothetical protein
MASPLVKLREEWGKKRLRLLWPSDYEMEMKKLVQVTLPQGRRNTPLRE